MLQTCHNLETYKSYATYYKVDYQLSISCILIVLYVSLYSWLTIIFVNTVIFVLKHHMIQFVVNNPL